MCDLTENAQKNAHSCNSSQGRSINFTVPPCLTAQCRHLSEKNSLPLTQTYDTAYGSSFRRLLQGGADASVHTAAYSLRPPFSVCTREETDPFHCIFLIDLIISLMLVFVKYFLCLIREIGFVAASCRRRFCAAGSLPKIMPSLP